MVRLLFRYGSPRMDSRLCVAVRSGRSRAAWAVFCAAAAVACGPEMSSDVAVARASVVYGQDGRVEVYEAPSTGLKEAALTVSVGLVDSNSVSMTADGLVRLDPSSLKEQQGLCDGER